MAFQPVVETAELIFEFTRSGVAHHPEIGVYLHRDGGWGSVNLNDLTDFYFAGFDTTWGLDDYLWENTSLTKVAARDLEVEFGNFGITSGETPGTLTGPMSSPNNAALIEFFGASSGAPRRGGVFWPDVLEGWVDGQGNLTTNLSADLPNDFGTMMTASLTSMAPYEHVIVSRWETDRTDPDHHVKVRRDPALTKPVTTYLGRPVVASQRGRRDRP